MVDIGKFPTPPSSVRSGTIIDLSLVVPVFNEQENVQILHEKVLAALSPNLIWELIFVDDGSTDSTLRSLKMIHKLDARVKIIELRGNCGQTPAMVAGIEYASGDVIVTMDGDLQNDPIDIPRFLAKLDEGYDIVVGWRENRKDALITRKLPSKIANAIIGRITGVPIKDNGCSLKAYRADLIRQIGLYSEMHRFIPAMASIAGSRIHEMPVRHHARIYGESKYGLKRIYKVILDLVVVKTLLSSIGSPLNFFARLAILPAMTGCAVGVVFAYNLAQGIVQPVILGTSLLWLITGVFIVFIGLLAEILYRTDSRKELNLASMTLKVNN